MREIEIPKDSCKCLTGDWDAFRLYRDIILNLPFWKKDADDKVEHALEIDVELEKIIALPAKICISEDAWGNLKQAMKLEGLQTMLEGQVNRLYMKCFKAVLKANKSSG